MADMMNVIQGIRYMLTLANDQMAVWDRELVKKVFKSMIDSHDDFSTSFETVLQFILSVQIANWFDRRKVEEYSCKCFDLLGRLKMACSKQYGSRWYGSR